LSVAPPAIARNDALTVAAIALAAMCLVTFDHEALGHGGACLALGGHILELTSAVFHCDRRSPWIAPAGPAANLAVGTLALLAGRRLGPRRPELGLFLLLVTSLSYFWEGGYAIHAMHQRDGDLYFAGQDFFGEPSLGWRVAAALAGAALFAATAYWTRCSLAFRWPDLREARRVGRIAWLAASLGAVLAAVPFALEHTGAAGWGDLRDAGLEIGGCAFLLLWGPRRAGTAAAAPSAAPPPAARYIARSLPMLAVAVLVYLAFVATLGRGIARIS
jgi:hypothetical protein